MSAARQLLSNKKSLVCHWINHPVFEIPLQFRVLRPTSVSVGQGGGRRCLEAPRYAFTTRINGEAASAQFIPTQIRFHYNAGRIDWQLTIESIGDKHHRKENVSIILFIPLGFVLLSCLLNYSWMFLNLIGPTLLIPYYFSKWSLHFWRSRKW